MAVYYLSFADISQPEGQRFLGATVVVAQSDEGAVKVVNDLGLNPGGEIAILKLSGLTVATMDADQRRYLNRFVPRDEVMADKPRSIRDAGIEDQATIVCQDCNPVQK